MFICSDTLLRTYKATTRQLVGMHGEPGIYARESAYLERYVEIGVAQAKVLRIAFPTEPDPDAADDHELLDRVFAYFEGKRDDFRDVDVALTVPTDQRAVLEATRQIPFGESVSVEQLARMTPTLDASDDDDQMLVREALDANPAPIVIPDHRVRDAPSAAPPEVEQKLRSLEGL